LPGGDVRSDRDSRGAAGGPLLWGPHPAAVVHRPFIKIAGVEGVSCSVPCSRLPIIRFGLARMMWTGAALHAQGVHQEVDLRHGGPQAQFAPAHLTDDQGWRIEIKKYPSYESGLAERNARRALREKSPTSTASATAGITARRTFGSWSSSPGGTREPVAGDRDAGPCGRGRWPRIRSWAVFRISRQPVWNPLGNQSNISTQRPHRRVSSGRARGSDGTVSVQFIHVGATRQSKDYWKKSPEVQNRIRQLGLKDEEELQSWFIRRWIGSSRSTAADSSAGTRFCRVAWPRGHRHELARHARGHRGC